MGLSLRNPPPAKGISAKVPAQARLFAVMTCINLDTVKDAAGKETLVEPAHEVRPDESPPKEGRRSRARKNAAIRREEARLAPYQGLARIIIKHRSEAGITQLELADLMGTSHSAVSRIESGWHTAKPETLSRLGEALGMRFVMGFESGPADDPKRELVTVGPEPKGK